MFELQRRLDEEGVPITVVTVHPGTVSTGTHPLLLETQQPHADETRTRITHRRAEWIQSMIAEPVHYVDVHPTSQGRLDDALRNDERARGGGTRKVQGGVHRAVQESRPAGAQGGARPCRGTRHSRDAALGGDGPRGRGGVGAVAAAMRRKPASPGVRVQASADTRPKPARLIRKSLYRFFSAHVAGHFTWSRFSFGFVPERWVAPWCDLATNSVEREQDLTHAYIAFTHSHHGHHNRRLSAQPPRSTLSSYFYPTLLYRQSPSFINYLDPISLLAMSSRPTRTTPVT